MRADRRVWHCIFAVITWLISAASPGIADTRSEDIDELRKRLAALEKKLERVLEQNEILEKKLTEATDTPRRETPPADETVKRIITEYFQDKEDRKKTPTAPSREASSTFEVGKNLKAESSWRNGMWAETADKSFKYTVGGVIQFDMGWFGASQDTVNSIGQLNNLTDPGLALSDGMDMRRARLRFNGLMWEQVEFFAQYDFAQSIDLRRRTLGITGTGTPNTDLEPAESIIFNEVYLGLVKVPVLGTVRIGRHRESLNFVTATSDTTQIWLERGLLFDAFNGDFNFSNGITAQQTYFNDRAYTLFGFFQNNTRNFSAVGDGEYAYDGRFTFLPVWNEEDQLWVHLGVDYSYRNLHFDQVRYRTRPMVRAGNGFQVPSIVSTGTIHSKDAQQIANLEFASAWGRWTFAAEGATSWVSNAFTGGSPLPNGTLPKGVKAAGTYQAEAAYVELLYFLTPDHRKYRKDRPGYDRVVPQRTFYLLEGEHGPVWSAGAWEIGIRYDYLDLTDGVVNGGSNNAVTFALNWYLNPNARVQGNYFIMNRDFAPTNDAGRQPGDLQGLGIRFNLDF